MARQKVKTSTDQRSFTLVYNDFLESNVLNYYEKMVFIAIKKFANNDTLIAFPSLKRLHSMTGISRSKIQEVIASLQEKGVLKVEHRTTKEKGHQSNIYTLYDFAELWNAGDVGEMAAVVDRYEEDRMVEALKSKGYVVRKEKELTSEPTKVTEVSTKLNQFDIVNTTPNSETSQAERYTIDQIRQYFWYDIMVADNKFQVNEIDSVMDILHDLLNTNKKTIRVAGEDKPAMVVIGKLWKLNNESIMYAIRKFGEQTERIQNPVAYMTTLLYKAPEQFEFDIKNQVNHDMAHWND